MIQCLFVGLGGFVGAVCRYLVGLIPFSVSSGFPVKTFFINVLGAFFIGFISETALKKGIASDSYAVLFLQTGLCGGFTTFSTFSLENIKLLENGHTTAALLYMFLSVVCCLAGVILGKLAASKFC